MLRHSSLSEHVAQKVEDWLASARDLTSMVQALRPTTKISKGFFEAGDPDDNDELLSSEHLDGVA